MFTQCTISISIQYPATFTEVLARDMASTEVAIEGSVSPLLTELFGGTILVDDVNVRLSASNFTNNDGSGYQD